jgi:NAD(P)H-hydrate epimerase
MISHHALRGLARVPQPRIVAVDEMRALEAAAVAAGTSERELQRRAALQLTALAQLMDTGLRGLLVTVLVGPGNNGRDAMLTGAHLARRGYRVALYLGPRHAVEAAELSELERIGAQIAQHAERDDGGLNALASWLDGSWLAVDGLLGVGSRGALRPPLDRVVEVLNRARGRRGARLLVVAVDVPSGIDADDGRVVGAAVHADVTAALAAVKAGTLRFPAAFHAGQVVCLSIGIQGEAPEGDSPRVLTPEAVASLVPPRDPSGHKGTFGKVLVIGGSELYLGAPLLSALSAARSGCGLVALAAPTPVQQAAAVLVPEATYAGSIDPERDPEAALATVRDAREHFDAVVLGPGLGRGAGGQQLVRGLLSDRPDGRWPPVVVDADALNALAAWPGWPREVAVPLVLTPHHVEMARLTGTEAANIEREVWETARRWAEDWGQIVVLKGPHTAVAEPGQPTYLFAQANPALATAGSGDVLAGLIGGLLAQGLGRGGAARLGVVAHARAAGVAMVRRGARSLLASDLPREIPRAIEQLRDVDAETSPPAGGRYSER